MTRRTASIDRDWFETLYRTDPDPWRFASSAYERDKYAASLAALPAQHFAAALEVGCSIGIFTRALAERCGRLVAIDAAESALTQARTNAPGENIAFENRRIPGEFPPGRFDLIVFSEVLYYLTAPDVERTAALAIDALRPGGTILLVHYLGDTDYPLTGDEAAQTFIDATALRVVTQTRTEKYRLDLLMHL